MRNLKTIVAVAMLIVINAVTILGATTFSDVPSNHWAYNQISRMAEQGYMLGDLDGKYYPDKKMDKFESSKIFARVAGYKYTGATADELSLYNKAYESNKALLDLYGEKYPKWNSSADREIAYLLEMNVLTPNDLNSFIGTTSTGVEGYVALTKEEMSVYMTKAVGKNNEALTGSYSHKFNDDSSISSDAKSYVYYLQKNGIISGDEYNYFYPNKAVSKAEFATVLDRTLSTFGTTTVDTSDNSTAIIGTVYNIYPTNNLIQIKNENNVVNTYTYTNSTVVTVNNVVSSISSLKSGDNIVAMVSSDKVIISIEKSVDSTSTDNSNTTDNTNSGNNNVSIDTPKYVIEGIVTLVSNDLVTKTVTIDTDIVGLNGKQSVESFVYIIDSDTEIYKNNLKSAFSGIKIGDEVRAEVIGNTVVKMELFDAERMISGELVEKIVEGNSVYPTFVVEFNDGTVKEYYGTKDTTYNRDGYGKVNFTQLKIGDDLDIKIYYDEMITVYADGKLTDKEGYIEAIHVDRDETYINVKDSKTKVVEKYVVSTKNVNVYDLRLGSYVEIYLDSKEVYDIDIIEQASDEPVTGFVYDVDRDEFTVYSEEYGYVEIYFDSKTVFIDSKTGDTLDYDDIDEDMNVLVVFSSDERNLATTVTILPN